jgi:hypothetical protein
MQLQLFHIKNVSCVERLGFRLKGKHTSWQTAQRRFMLDHKSAPSTLSSCTCSLKVNNGRQKNSFVAVVWQAQEEYS